jgi:hypothetical protein
MKCVYRRKSVCPYKVYLYRKFLTHRKTERNKVAISSESHVVPVLNLRKTGDGGGIVCNLICTVSRELHEYSPTGPESEEKDTHTKTKTRTHKSTPTLAGAGKLEVFF